MNQNTFSFPQIINRSSHKIELSSDTKSINECLGILLRTRPGELLGDPGYGSDIVPQLFEIDSNNTLFIITEKIANCINNRVSQISVNSSDIKIYKNGTGKKYKITIPYTILQYETTNETTIIIDAYNKAEDSTEEE